MKRTTICGFMKILFLMVLMTGLVVTAAGCGSKSASSAGGQEKQKTESQSAQDQTVSQAQDQATSQAQNQDQAKEEKPDSEGLTSFQTKDIYGNDVNQDIFQNYKLTLVNVWGTFCKPCLGELPELGELQKEYAPKGVNIVGIVCDVQNEDMEIVDDQIALAKKIVDSTGAKYTHMVISNEMLQPVMSQFDAIPASFFVDSNGNIVSQFYIGAKTKKEWTDLIEENLAKLKQ